MALKVGELYATMRVDDAQFRQGLDQSGRSFDRLRSSVGAGVKTLATAFTAATTATAGLGVAAFKVGLDYNRLQQSSRAALTTLLGSAEAANAQMDKLDEFARSSPFAKQVFIEAQQQLIGFGVAAEDVLPTLDAIQNAVAAVGGSNEDISELTRIIAQVQSSGKITAETLNQLGARGVDAATLIGSQMGKTGAQIREDITEGALGAGEAIAALTEGMTERFGGATDNIKQQMDGAADRVKGAFRDIGSSLAAPFVDPKGGGMLVVWTNEVADAMRAAEGKVRPLVDLLTDRFGPEMASISPVLQSVKGAINSWDLSQVNRQLDELSRYTPVVAGLGTALFALGGNSLGLGRLGLAISPVAAGLAAVAATSPEVRAMLGEFGRSLEPLLPVLGEFGVLLADTAMHVLAELTPALSDLLVAGGDLATTLGTSLVPIVGDLVVAATPLVGVLADVVGWVADLPAPVLAAGLAFVALHGPIGDVVSSVSGPLRSAFTTMNETMAASRAVAQETGGQISTLRAGFEGAKASATGLGAAMRGALITSGIGLAISGVAAALAAFATAAAEARARADEYEQTLDSLGNTTDETTQKIVDAISETRDANWLEGIFGSGESAIERAEEFGIATDMLVGYIRDEEDAIESVRASIDAYVDTLRGDERDSAAERGRRLISVLEEERDALDLGTDTAQRKADATAALGDREQGAADAADQHRRAQQELADQLNEGIDATLSAAEAALRHESASQRTADALNRKREAEAHAAAVAEDAAATDEQRRDAAMQVQTATHAVEEAILAEVRALENDIDAKARNNASASDLYEVMRRGRERFVEQQIALGLTADEAHALADAYGLIPGDVHTRVGVSGIDSALSRLGVLDQTLNNLNGKQVTASVAIRQLGQAAIASGGFVGDFAAALGYAGGGMPRRFPLGGPVHGPGTGTSDEIPAWLSNMEFVHKAAAVQKYGLPFMHAVNSGTFPVELARPFAVGGSAASPAPGRYAAPMTAMPNLTVYVENPWTGEQVRATVRAEADQRISQRQRQADRVGPLAR